MINMKQENVKNTIGNTEKVYLVKESALVDTSHKENKLKKRWIPAAARITARQENSRMTVKEENRKITEKEGRSDSNAVKEAANKLTGNQDALLIYLHNIIQKQFLFYQDELTLFGKKTMLIEFDLSPGGVLSNISMSDESSVELKKEVVSIMKSLPPFVSLPETIKEEEHFKLQVDLL